jgi:hypothetical protein
LIADKAKPTASRGWRAADLRLLRKATDDFLKDPKIVEAAKRAIAANCRRVINMWEYFAQNNELWMPAVFGVAAILSALYYQIFGWRWNGNSIDVSLLATILLAFAGSVVFPRHMPYPPFTWLQWFGENVPKHCSGACLERDLLFFSTVLLTSVALFAVFQVILWGPWWLGTWRRRLEKCQVEDAEREAESNVDHSDLTAMASVFVCDDAARSNVADTTQPRAGLRAAPSLAHKVGSSVQPHV